MEIIQVTGNGPLYGETRIQGSKNAVLPILAASLLIKGVCCFRNCPKITDVECMCSLLVSMGAKVNRQKEDLIVDASVLTQNELPEKLVKSMRSSVILLGSALARMKEITLDYPGGCVIGKRPIDIHLDLMKKMGAEITVLDGHIHAKAAGLSGVYAKLPFPSVGATENGVLAAVTAKGRTVLEGCAKEPEIQHLCCFLNAAGARIKGIGTNRLVIDGVNSLNAVTYRIPSDRIVAGTYLFSSVAAKGRITLWDAPVSEMKAAFCAAHKMGARIQNGNDYIRITQKKRPEALAFVKTMVYPGFPTDLQSVLLCALACSRGRSIVEETIFSDRFKIAGELNRMGADINIEGKRAYIKGKATLRSGKLSAEDLRGGAALVLAGICAEGESRITNCHYIERGYEDICRDYRLLGAAIEKTGRTVIEQP